jgi:hypothetical protein
VSVLLILMTSIRDGFMYLSYKYLSLYQTLDQINLHAVQVMSH